MGDDCTGIKQQRKELLKGQVRRGAKVSKGEQRGADELIIVGSLRYYLAYVRMRFVGG